MKMWKSMAVLGISLGMSAAAWADGALLTKVQNLEESSSATLTAQNLKTWKRLSFNATNLVVKNGEIIINSVKVGPIIQQDLMAAEKMVEVNFSIRVLEPATPKAVLQTLVVLDSAVNAEKSNLVSCRVGKDHIRFADDKPVAITPDENGNINVKVLVDVARGMSEFYVNGAVDPVIIRKALAINKGDAKVSFGDGSSAIEGSCAIISAEVKEY